MGHEQIDPRNAQSTNLKTEPERVVLPVTGWLFRFGRWLLEDGDFWWGNPLECGGVVRGQKAFPRGEGGFVRIATI